MASSPVMTPDHFQHLMLHSRWSLKHSFFAVAAGLLETREPIWSSSWVSEVQMVQEMHEMLNQHKL